MESPLRIVHLNSLLTGGGTDDQCVKLSAVLHKLGQHSVIAGPSARRFSPIIADLKAPFFDTGAHASKWKFIRRAAKFIRDEKMQIVHGHHGRDIWPTILAARLSGMRPKIVLTRHMAKSPSSFASRHFLLGQCDVLIAVSDFTAKVLTQGDYEPDSPEEERRVRLPIKGDYSKIKVLPGGIDTHRFRSMDGTAKRVEMKLQPGEYAFAVVGGFDGPRGKGQREYLKAAAQIHQQIPQARFLIIGSGTMEKTLREDIERLGLSGKAWLTGQLSDMPRVMNAIDCLVHPQIGTEALGLVVCEAHACGKPVIASALDGIPQAFAAGNYGKLVPQEDISALAAAMASQFREPALSANQIEEMHARVEAAFSLQQMGVDALRLYRNLMMETGAIGQHGSTF